MSFPPHRSEALNCISQPETFNATVQEYSRLSIRYSVQTGTGGRGRESKPIPVLCHVKVFKAIQRTQRESGANGEKWPTN